MVGHTRLRATWLLCAVLAAWPTGSHGAAAAADGWSVAGSYRLRLESLDHPFLRTATGSDQLLAQRLLVHAQVRGAGFRAGVELQDARTWLDDTGTPLGTDDVNTLEPLQAYVGWDGSDVVTSGDVLQVTAGRFTMDVGSRRLVARNRFRNASNAFSGIYGLWRDDAGSNVQAFVSMPVRRRPVSPERLRDNDHELDAETSDDVFWGLVAGADSLPRALAGEVYLMGLHESDLLDRDLYTIGGRVYRGASPGAWDFEVEAALQVGRSQDLPSGVTTRQDHRAGFVHLHVGRTLDMAGRPRLVFQCDYASGDRDPADGDSNRFDTLFGARRSDFGPTGIYGALARSNLISPELRMEFRPGSRSSAYLGYRAAFLASDRDLLATALLRDAEGASGRFVGQQIEGRWVYVPGSGAVEVETGAAYLIHERFLEQAPGAVNEGDTVYAYVQATWSF